MIYLDNAATMPADDEMVDYYTRQIKAYPANPASVHKAGHDALKAKLQAVKTLTKYFDCRPDEITFTSGGTESINLALKGTLEANPRLGRRILISAAEHPAVRNTARWLSEQGCETEIIPLAGDGSVDLQALEKALLEPCALISLIHVNNETGAVCPVASVSALRDRLQPTAKIHLDGVQTTGKTVWSFSAMGIDLFSGSGHKIGAPRGIGWLIHRKGLRINPILHGGGQQKNIRSGTENVPQILALARAVQLSVDAIDVNTKRVKSLRDALLDHLNRLGVSYGLLSPPDAVPHIMILHVEGLRGETMLHALADRGICVSTGSACSSHSKAASPVLKAMGIADIQIAESIRISISHRLGTDEIEHTAQQIAAIEKWLARK